ncbi:MAG: DUF6562 domain-containing protein [Prevotella sp.]|nr:DUF6562 domain-containing protein [Prevotella sp.]
MKKTFLTLLSLGLLFASCSDVEETSSHSGVRKTVNFTLTAPESFEEGTRAGEYKDSGKGGLTNNDGAAITYHLAFYYEGELEWSATKQSTANTVSFSPELVMDDSYQLVAYATFNGEQADLANIAVTNGLNNEKNDAYYYTKDVVAKEAMSATLTRPSAKVRFLAKDYEYFDDHDVTINNVQVTYKEAHADKFNALTGVYGEGTIKTFNTTPVKYTDTPNTIFTDYVPASETGVEEEMTVEVNYTVGATTKTKTLVLKPVPLKRNYITTISANLLKKNIDIDIDIEETIDINFDYAAKNGGLVTLTKNTQLSKDYEVTGDLIIELAGSTLTYTGDNVLFRVKDGGSVTINGQTAGSAVVTNPTTPSATGGNGYVVLVEEGGVATFNGGVYDAKQTCTIAQAKGGKVYVTDGEFSVDPTKYGTKYMFNHTDALKDVGLIEISGGKFHGYDPANSESESPAMNFVKDGYKSVDNGDGTYSVVINADVVISTKAEFLSFANDVNVNGKSYSGKTIALANDIDLENEEWTPIGQTGGYGIATYFSGTFDGKGHTIKNLKIENTNAGKNYAAGLFGFIDAGSAEIKNLTIDGANVKGHHWTAALVGFLTGNVTNCHVKNANIVCTHANDDACGDKAGTIVGYVNSGLISKSSATDCTVKAGRDAGQIVGASKTTYVSDCTATNVTVTANGDCTGANINNTIIGRVL